MSSLLCNNPCSKKGYFGGLIDSFGLRYIVFIALIYGVNQGTALNFGTIAKNFWFQDTIEEGGIELSTLDSQKVSTFSRIPWQIKSVFGILSDAFAIFGYHRKYYLSIATILGALGWFMLGVGPNPATAALIIYLTFTNLAVAFPDVLIDGSVAIKCQKYPRHAVDLQSLLWGSLGVGGIISSAAAGFVYEAVGSRTMFTAVSVVPLCIAVLSLLNWVDDQPDPKAAEKRAKFFVILAKAFQRSSPSTVTDLKVVDIDDVSPAEHPMAKWKSEAALDRITGRLYILAAILCAIAIGVGSVGNSLEGDQVKEWFLVWIACCCCISVFLWVFLKDISKDLASTAIYIFLKGAVQPYNYLIYFWQRTKDANCCGVLTPGFNVSSLPTYCTDSNSGVFIDYDFESFPEGEEPRPCLDDAFISYANVGGYVFLVIGVIIYNKYLSWMSYRKIWTISTVAFFIISWLDLIYVKRWNVKIGLNDELFVIFGSEIISTVIDRFDSMPFFVLAAKLCPPGVEGTLFAMLMGLSNFGFDMGGYLGTVLEGFLEVSYPTYEGLDTYVYVRNACKIIPLFLIPLLVPKGGPLDPSEYYEGEEGDIEGDDDLKSDVQETLEAHQEALLGEAERQDMGARPLSIGRK